MKVFETRLLPLPTLKSDYAIVSMPEWAWYWLDDLVKRDYPGGYKSLVKAISRRTANKGSAQQDLKHILAFYAKEHCDRRMGSLYNLANDNLRPTLSTATTAPEAPAATPNTPFSTKSAFYKGLPTVYRLFHFMPHATSLTTVWERRNYHLKG